eukprot:CAMPEP_0202956496 /NCGR_PEP_ID=MMETSP1396-20130829/1000_1 /ASSEMBLY_ACC=CAM_ASM_000872 /TAXON_ID= /ORGANISM="Pseudokeronopsis sp., Strain Brazil" /LENGTH=88 /DNA_ID=CAMNT_0049673531 /DNA_START=438 /DNA_END=704 /DNA_ORIENTATION=-
MNSAKRAESIFWLILKSPLRNLAGRRSLGRCSSKDLTANAIKKLRYHPRSTFSKQPYLCLQTCVLFTKHFGKFTLERRESSWEGFCGA